MGIFLQLKEFEETGKNVSNSVNSIKLEATGKVKKSLTLDSNPILQTPIKSSIESSTSTSCEKKFTPAQKLEHIRTSIVRRVLGPCSEIESSSNPTWRVNPERGAPSASCSEANKAITVACSRTR